MFPRDNIRKTFTVMHYPVFELYDTLSIAFLVCIILYIGGKKFRCSVFTFVRVDIFIPKLQGFYFETSLFSE